MRPAPAPIKAILYDLDGTLVDHFGAIHRAIAHAQQQLGLPVSSYDKVRATVGGSIEVTMARLTSPELAPQAIPLYIEHLQQIMFEDLHPLPGATWLMENLHQRGFRQGVLTNKQGTFARAITHHLGWDKWLDHVFGTFDTPWRKPAREFVLHAVNKFGVAPGEAVLIGDSPFDIEAAVNAGLHSQVVATGSHSRAQLLAHQPAPDAVFENLHELGVATFGLPTPVAKPLL